MTRRYLLKFTAVLGASARISAHDDKIHKATIGEVTAMSADGLTLKTKDGVVKVKYSSRTTFELNKKPAEKSGVKIGDRAGVIGSKLPTGELMANEIILGLPKPKTAEPRKPEHKH